MFYAPEYYFIDRCTKYSRSYKVLMSKLVCSLDSRICMIHRCENCPGTDNLRKFLIETVKRKRWTGIFHYCIPLNYTFA